jgi:hypothetical protein
MLTLLCIGIQSREARAQKRTSLQDRTSKTRTFDSRASQKQKRIGDNRRLNLDSEIEDPNYCAVGYVYGFSWTYHDGRYIYAQAHTEVDECLAAYYDPGVRGRLFEGGVDRDRVVVMGESAGYANYYPADVYLFWPYPILNEIYETYSNHWIRDYYTGLNKYYGPTRHAIRFQPAQPTPTPTPTPIPTPTPQCSTHSVQIIGGDKNITGTSGNALIGGIVTLTGLIDGSSAEANGIYKWSFQDGQESDLNAKTIKNVYWLSQGTKTVKLEFTPAGESCRSVATGTVNVVLPTLESYKAFQTSASVHSGAGCSSFGQSLGQTAFQLGCGFSQPGVKFDATVKAPFDLISIPSDSKIKFVQFFNAYAISHSSNGYECASTRSSEADTTTGWRRDGNDPYGLAPPAPFNESGVAVHSAVDSPGYAIDTFDYLRNNDYFEMYLVYIAGDSLNPRYQQVLSMIPWNWSGEVFFSSPGVWSNYTAYPQAQTRFGVAPNTRIYNPGDPTSISWSSCSSVPDPDPTPDLNPCYRSGWKCDPMN